MKRLLLISLMAFLLIVSAACAGDGLVGAGPGGSAVLTPEQIDEYWTSMFEPDTMHIIVNGETIEAPMPITDSETGTVMLPVVSIAEALGYDVSINHHEEVIIEPVTFLAEGMNDYFRGRGASIELGSAPIIRDGVMFVPSLFFQYILSATVSGQGGNIYVDTVEDTIENEVEAEDTVED